MAILSKSACTLRIMGDDLDPDEITRLPGKPPTRADRKGERVSYPPGSRRIAHTGSWRILADNRQPADLDGQIAETLAGATDGLSVWRDLGHRYQVEMFVGLFLEDGNEGLGISGETIGGLGARQAVSKSRCTAFPKAVSRAQP